MANRKAAIDQMCKSCIYDSEAEGTWRKQVEDCTSTNCALHSVRPRTTATQKRKTVRNCVSVNNHLKKAEKGAQNQKTRGVRPFVKCQARSSILSPESGQNDREINLTKTMEVDNGEVR